MKADTKYKLYKQLGIEIPEELREARNKEKRERKREIKNGSPLRSPGPQPIYHDEFHAKKRILERERYYKKKAQQGQTP